MFEHAKRVSLGRRSDNRRRSERSTKFHLVLRFCIVGPELRTLLAIHLNCYMPILLRDTFHRFYPDHSSVTLELQSDRLLLRNLDPFPEYPRSVPVSNFFAFVQESIE